MIIGGRDIRTPLRGHFAASWNRYIGCDRAVSVDTAADIRRCEAFNGVISWGLSNIATGSGALIGAVHPDTPHTSMGADSSNENNGDSGKSEEPHDLLGYH